MLNSIKKFVKEHPVEIILATTMITTVAVLLTKNRTALKGGGFLELSGATVNDLLAGKEVLLDCLDDAYLLVKYIPKT